MQTSRDYPFSEDRPLPERTGIVVIGGGVVGVTAALTLAEWGVPVVLCEKGRVAGEQSSRNWGWIRAQGRDLAELPLMFESQARWRELGPRLDTDIGLRQAGCTYLAETDDELEKHLSWIESAKPFQIDTAVLDTQETDALLGQEGRRFKGAIHTASDMHAEPALAVPALARLAARAGAQIFENTAVRCLDKQAGRVTAVVTEHGRIACDGVILAGGAWCRSFLENTGFDLPQLAVGSQAQRTARAPAIAPGPVGCLRSSIRIRKDGGYTVGRTGNARFDLIPAAFNHMRRFWPLARQRWHILKLRFGPAFFGALGHHRWDADQMSPFETARVLEPMPDIVLLDRIMDMAGEVYPQLKGIGVVERWGGMIDVTPDELPIIGDVPGLEGLTLATGLSGHGFGIGPGVGMVAAQMATGRDPVVDVSAFRYQRFAQA